MVLYDWLLIFEELKMLEFLLSIIFLGKIGSREDLFFLDNFGDANTSPYVSKDLLISDGNLLMCWLMYVFDLKSYS